MTSSQKRKQARQNGAKAAGTKSAAGTQNSAKNSLKHGLTGKAIVLTVLTNESQAQFDELHEAYVVEFRPESVIEMDLVDQMVAAQWRLRRIWHLQTATLDLKMDQQEAELAKAFKQIDQCTRATVAFTALANDEKALDLFLRYETAYTRMHQRAMNNLSKHRKEKLRNDPEPPSEPPIASTTPERSTTHDPSTTPTQSITSTTYAPSEPRALASGNVNYETTHQSNPQHHSTPNPQVVQLTPANPQKTKQKWQ